MTNKKGDVKFLVEILVIIFVAFVILFIIPNQLYGASGGVLKIIKDKLNPTTKEDIEKQKETERVSKELLDNAESFYEQFNTIVKKCVNENSNEKMCTCGSMDFTKLNDYSLVLSNDKGNQYSEIRDVNKVPIKGTSLGKFLILQDYNGVPPNDNLFNELSDYSKRLIYILFSKDKLTFKLSDNTFDKSKGKMEKIIFRKLTKDVFVVDESDYGIRKCST